jgi:hypothetical protein
LNGFARNLAGTLDEKHSPSSDDDLLQDDDLINKLGADSRAAMPQSPLANPAI